MDTQLPCGKKKKKEMSFSLYRWLGETLFQLSSPQDFFTHATMTTSWNLLCSIDSTTHILVDHLEWMEDALCINFAHSKTAPEGDPNWHMRYIYANPFMPEICPLVSLGVYFLVFGVGQILFPERGQDSCYRKQLHSVLSSANNQQKLAELGVDPQEIGSNSARKGGVAHCFSGTTSPPSTVAICIRGGWGMPGARKTYMSYCAPGDQYLGRVLCGLPPISPNFATLPPFFREYSEIVFQAVYICFPGIKDSQYKVFAQLLAAVVWASDFLIATIPAGSCLYQTSLFAKPGLLQTLKPLVVCHNGSVSDPISATGIPPHIHILTLLANITHAISTLPADATSTVVNAVDDSALVTSGQSCTKPEKDNQDDANQNSSTIPALPEPPQPLPTVSQVCFCDVSP